MLDLDKEKVRPVLEHQTDRKENIFNDSISQSEKLAIEMDTIVREPTGLDSFIGNIKSFKSYLKAQLIFLQTGIIAP